MKRILRRILSCPTAYRGQYHAYQNNPEADTETFVRTIEEIVKCLQPIL